MAIKIPVQPSAGKVQKMAAGKVGGKLQKVAAGSMGHPQPKAMPVSTDRGNFKIK